MKSPCMNCEDRFVGCHSTCEKYQEYRERLNNAGKVKEESNEFAHACYKNDKYRRECYGRQI